MSSPRVLVVEDDPLIAMLVEDLLAECGCAVAGSADTVDGALAALAADRPDIALLDYHLGNEDSLPVAEAARVAGVPVIVASGSSLEPLTGALAGARLLPKPYSLEALRDALSASLSGGAGTSSITSFNDSNAG